MDPDSMILLAVLVVMVAMSGYFSATETAFTSLNRIRLKSRADNGDKKAEKTLALAEDYDKLLSTILIGNNIVNNVAATLSTLLFIKLIGQANGPAVSTIVLTVVVLIFGEISPKSLAKESPEAFAMFSAPLLRLFMAVLTPLNFLFGLWKKLLTRLFHKSEDEGITDEELVTMVEEAEDQGGLDREESQLIRSAIRFDDLEAGDILTPRVDVVAVDEGSTLEEVASVFAAEGYSRLPVYHESIDDVVGVIHQKDLFSARYHGRDQLKPLVRPVLHITEKVDIYPSLTVNEEYVKTKYNLLINSDIVLRNFTINARGKQYNAFLLYIDGMVDSQIMDDFVLKPLMLRNKSNSFEGSQNKVISEAVTNNITVRKVKKFDLPSYLLGCLMPQNSVTQETSFEDVISGINSRELWVVC